MIRKVKVYIRIWRNAEKAVPLNVSTPDNVITILTGISGDQKLYGKKKMSLVKLKEKSQLLLGVKRYKSYKLAKRTHSKYSPRRL